MNFTFMSPLAVGAGLATLAGFLYLLQRLRIRYREVPVVTTLFWRAAVREAPARTFRERFRHLPAYLLILVICSSVWISIAGPRWDGATGGETYVLLLDASAGMARGDRFQRAVAALERDIGKLPSDSRRVLWVGGPVRNVLAPGEHRLLLSKRLERLRPEAAPSSMEKQLLQLAMVGREDSSTTAIIYGDAPVSREVLDGLPESLRILRAREPEAERGNIGFTALGAGPASSGVWTNVDVFFKIESDEAGDIIARDAFQVTINGKAPRGVEISETGNGAFTLVDVPANGELLELRLVGDDLLALDDVARLRLPDRAPIRVRLSSKLEPVLGALLAADPAVVRVQRDPHVVIRTRGEDLDAGTPVLEFVPMEEQQAAFQLTSPSDREAGATLMTALQSIGLNQIDATALAKVSQRPIEVTLERGQTPVVSVWGELLSAEYNFVRSRSFPLFIARALRWLAGVNVWYPYVAAGRPLVHDGFGGRADFVGGKGSTLDTLGVDFVPEQAGNLPVASGDAPLAVSLLDPRVTVGLPESENTSELELAYSGLAPTARPPEVVTWMLILALLLMSAEWILHRANRLP